MIIPLHRPCHIIQDCLLPTLDFLEHALLFEILCYSTCLHLVCTCPFQLHCVEMLILSKAFLKLIVDPHLDFLIFKLFLVFLKSLDISNFKFLSKWLLNPGYSKFEGNLPKTFFLSFVHDYAKKYKLMMSQIIKLMSVLFLLVIAEVHVNCRKVKTPLFCLDPLFLLDSLFLLCFFFLSPLSVSTNHLIFCILSCCTSKKYYFSRSIPPLHLMAHAVLKNFLLHFFWKVSIAQSFFKSLFL